MLTKKRDWGRTAKTPDSSGRYRCSKCREWKPPAEFNKSKSQKSGLSYACRPCMRAQVRRHNLPTKYGITVEEYEAKLLAQNNCCACCGEQFQIEGTKNNRPCVDHNHVTNEVRDLLCGRCNIAAGNVSDSSVRAQQLAEYLKKWKC